MVDGIPLASSSSLLSDLKYFIPEFFLLGEFFNVVMGVDFDWRAGAESRGHWAELRQHNQCQGRNRE
jgi:hypothetical protein